MTEPRDPAGTAPDVITLEILGCRDGTPGVDYTVNAALGFPLITGPSTTAAR